MLGTADLSTSKFVSEGRFQAGDCTEKEVHQVSPILALVGAPPEPVRILGQPFLCRWLFQP